MLSVISQIGAQSERWRYRFEDAADARRHAAKSVGTEALDKDVKSIIKDVGSDVKFIEGFNEVPIQLLDPDQWEIAWSRPWQYEDNILHTEALALCWSVEHSLRANRNFGRRILFLSDNLPLTLGACKGRAKSGFLSKPLRMICAFALATGSKFHVRWIPSEWNTADRPSRAITQWSSRGLHSWFQDRSDVVSRQNRKQTVKSSHSSQHGDKGEVDHGTSVEEKKSSCSAEHSPNWSDLSRGPKCEAANNRRLHQEIQGIQGLADDSSTGHSKSGSNGQCVDRVPSGDVRCRQGGERRNQSCSSHQVPCATPLRCIGPNFKGPPGLEPRCAAATKNANSYRGADGHHWENGECESGRVRTAAVSPILNLHEAWGVQPTTCEATSSTPIESQSDIQVLGHSSPPSGGSSSRKDRCVRCISDSGLRRLDVPHAEPADCREGGKRSALDSKPRRPKRSVQPSHQVSAFGEVGTDPICTSSWRSQSRRPCKTAANVGSQAEGKVELRCVPEKVRERSQTPNRIGQGSKSSQGIWPKSVEPIAHAAQKPAPDAQGARWNSAITKRMRQKVRSRRSGPKSLSGAVVLKRIFRDLTRQYKGQFHGVFLDIFSGDGSVSHYLSRNGFPVIKIDICVDSRFDVLNRDIFQTISDFGLD